MLGNNLQSVDDTRDVAQDCQEDVDEEIGIATALEEDTKRWEDNGENDLADITMSPTCQPYSSPVTLSDMQVPRLKHSCGQCRKQ